MTIKQTDADRLRAFQLKQAQARQAAGIAPKHRKSEHTTKREEYLYDPAKGVFADSYAEKLYPARRDHWRHQRALQYAWAQAQDAVRGYGNSNTLTYLYGCMRKAVKAHNIILLNRIEEITLGSVMTAGSLEERHRFWAYVECIRSRKTPPALLAIVNIEAAAKSEYLAQIDRELANSANGFRRDEMIVMQAGSSGKSQLTPCASALGIKA